MQTSGIPARVAVPFADSGTKNTIPVPSQVAVTPGLASYTTGFPPLTMVPITAGGVPPYGADFNGILNAITNAVRWSSAGSGYPFDNTFAGTVSGYPKGALLPASDYSGYWLNTTEANATSPENNTSAPTGWVPGVHYGVTALTGLSNSSITLTTLQAAKPRITLAGTLTANINIIFPAWTKGWVVNNNCTGAFSVTCKTPSGAGVVIPAGISASIVSNGVDILPDSLIANSNLSEISRAGSSAQASARTNLGLGTASVANVGSTTGSTQIPDMTFWNQVNNVNGYEKHPTGIITQWGTVTTSSAATVNVTFPVPFPNACFSIVGIEGNNLTSAAIYTLGNMTSTGFGARGWNVSGAAINGLMRWFAVGV